MKEHFRYWINPMAVILTMAYVYSTNIFGLSYLIAPNYNREFGVLENVQLLILLSIFVSTLLTWRRATSAVYRLLFGFVSLAVLFVFLEEMDYGLHFYDLLTGVSPEQMKKSTYDGSIRNIHNQGRVLIYMKWGGYLFLVFLIIIFPRMVDKWFSQENQVHLFVPSKYLIYSLMALAVTTQITLYMDDHIKANSIEALDYNTAEFEETFIYYMIGLYLWQVCTSFDSISITYTEGN